MVYTLARMLHLIVMLNYLSMKVGKICEKSTGNLWLIGCHLYTLSEAWSGVNWADLMATQGAFGTDFYDKSILRPKHRANYLSGRPVIKICPKGALASHEIRAIHSAQSLGQSIAAKKKSHT